MHGPAGQGFSFFLGSVELTMSMQLYGGGTVQYYLVAVDNAWQLHAERHEFLPGRNLHPLDGEGVMKKWILVLLGALIACALVVFAAVVTIDVLQDASTQASNPVVDIYSPTMDDLLTTGQPLMLQAVARDPDGLKEHRVLAGRRVGQT